MSIKKIAIVDADIVGRRKHRFPNLASMKLSSYHKSIGDSVDLVTDYDALSTYDMCYVSKVFTDTEVPNGIEHWSNVICGGTGFYYDDAPSLPHHIEHIMPDYHLYDNWISKMIGGGTRIPI